MKKEKLSSICDIKNGFAFKSSYYVDSGYRVIRITNVQKGHVVDNDPKFISKEIADKADDFKLRCGDILISLTGNVGRVGRIQSSHLPAVLNQRVGLIRPKSDRIDERYLFQYLNSDEFEQEAIKNSNGVAQLNLSSKWIENYLIPLPPPDDQKRIAYLLGKVEKLIGDRRSHLQQLDDLLNSVFLNMFGDPVRNEKGWVKEILGKLASSFKYGTNTKSNNDPSNGIPVLRIPNVVGGKLDLTDIKYSILDDAELEKTKLIAGDLLLVRTNGNPEYIGRSAVFDIEKDIYAYASYLIRVRLESANTIRPDFLNFVINFPSYRSSLVTRAKTTAGNYNINTASLKTLIIPLPPIELQNQFATIVKKIESIKSCYLQSLTDLEILYGALSQKAFKGELDLSRIPLIEDSEEMTTDKTIEPQDSQPTTETYNLPAPSNLAELETLEGRQALLEQWLNTWLEHLNNEPFSPQPFLDAAQQRLLELTEDNPLEWELGAADYEQITQWLIKSLDNGNIKQIYENTKNQVQVKAANP